MGESTLIFIFQKYETCEEEMEKWYMGMSSDEQYSLRALKLKY
jgi:hypothetical protein